MYLNFDPYHQLTSLPPKIEGVKGDPLYAKNPIMYIDPNRGGSNIFPDRLHLRIFTCYSPPLIKEVGALHDLV